MGRGQANQPVLVGIPDITNASSTDRTHCSGQR
jgi:hypothetical protein